MRLSAGRRTAPSLSRLSSRTIGGSDRSAVWTMIVSTSSFGSMSRFFSRIASRITSTREPVSATKLRMPSLLARGSIMFDTPPILLSP